MVYTWEAKANGTCEWECKLAVDLPFDTNLVVYLETSTRMETGLMVGILWPADVYKRVNGEEPKADQLEEASEARLGRLQGERCQTLICD